MERIRQKIGRIQTYVHYLEEMQADCETKFNTNHIYRGAVLHYLYLMADTCIALAEMVIKKRGLRPPQTYYEAFDILSDHGILEKDFARSFAAIAGFRNFLAHDYDQVDAQLICRDALAKLPEVKIFLRQIGQALNV